MTEPPDFKQEFSSGAYSPGPCSSRSSTSSDKVNISGAESANANRRNREFTPDARKDDRYWERRRKNNEAAKRSREKRRMNDIVMEQRLVVISEENNRHVTNVL